MQFALAAAMALVAAAIGVAAGLALRNRDLRQQLLEHARAGAAAARDRDRLQHILDTAPVGFAISIDGVVRFANPRSYELIRLTGSSLDDVYVDPGERRRMLEIMARAGIVRDHEVRMHGPNGETRQILATIMPTEYEGQPAILAWLTDIEKLKAAQSALDDQLQLHQALLNTIPNPIFYKGPDARFLGFNRAYLEAFGVREPDLIGKNVLDAAHLRPEDRAAFYERDAEIIRDGKLLHMELSLPFADGRLRETIYTVSGFRRSDGSPGGVVGIIVDISVRKEAERAMEQARVAAEEGTRAKSMFLANMSHEIRTPMNAIIGLSHLALGTELSARQRDYVQKIHNGGNALLGLINDILDFSKIEAGRLDLETVDFDLDEVFDSVAIVAGHWAQEKGLDYRVDVAPDVPRALRGDPLRLGQVLVNLVNNAVKFTQAGEVAVSVRLLEGRGEQVRLEFSVRDTGIGMSAEQAAGLFRPFTQADGSTTRKFGGTGLGLSICKRLVELMEGSSRVESRPGAGSCFRFDCLLQLAAGGESATRSPVAIQVPRFTGARILLVDDNDINQQIAVELLEAAGLAVDVCANGREALVRLQSAGPADYDLVFMDLQMPEMDGHEATKAIRAATAFDALPVIAMTAHAAPEERERCMQEGMNGLLVKPVHPTVLYGELRKWLAAKEVAPAPAPPADTTVPSAAAALHAIPGLDVATGLRNVLGWPAYEGLLRRFLVGQAGAVQQARDALDAADATGARRAMHTLRGTAASIGAGPLAALAGQAEQMIANGEPMQATLDSVAHALELLLDALALALPAVTPSEPAAVADPEAEDHATSGLLAMLANDDAEAVEFVREHRGVLSAALGAEFPVIERLVGNYALPDASKALREALRRRKEIEPWTSH